MSKKSNQPEALLEIWDILCRHHWRFIVPAFLITAGMLAASLFLPRKYKGDAIFERRTDMVLAEMLSRGVSEKFVDPLQSLNNELAGSPAIDHLIETIQASEEGAKAIAAAQLTPADLREMVDQKIVVSHTITSRDLDRIQVSFVATEPRLARLVVNHLVQNYIDRTEKRMSERLHQSAQFFRQEVANSQALIEDLENRKLHFEIENGDLLPDNPTGLDLEIEDIQTQLADARRMRDMAAARVEAMKRQLASTPETQPVLIRERNPELVRLEEKRRDLLDQLTLFVKQYKMTEKHPDVQDLRRSIAQLEEEIAGTEQEVVTKTQIQSNPKRAELELMLTQAETEFESFSASAAQLELDVQRVDEQGDQVFPVRAAYRQLSRDVDQAQRQLSFWEDNLRRVELSLAAETGDRGIRLEFLKPCGPIHRPVSPHLFQIFMVAVGMGVVGGAVSVFLAHRSEQTFHNSEQLAAAFDMPLVGSVSEIISRKQKSVRKLRQMILYPTSAMAMFTVLLGFAMLLYLNLERPEDFENLTGRSGTFVQSPESSHPASNESAQE